MSVDDMLCGGAIAPIGARALESHRQTLLIFFIFFTLHVILCSHPQATRPEHVEGLIDRDELAVILKRRAEISKDLNNNVDLTKRMYEALDGCINRAGGWGVACVPFQAMGVAVTYNVSTCVYTTHIHGICSPQAVL